MTLIIPVSIGLLFGLALQKAGLSHYDKIINQFRFKDNTMMQFMLSAIATGLITLYLLEMVGLVPVLPQIDSYLLGNLLGGLVFGVGMAIAGCCPGTILSGIGQGNLDYLLPGFLGFLCGGLLFGLSFEPFFLPLTQYGNLGRTSFTELFSLNRWLFVAAFAVVTIVFVVLCQHNRERR
jgi:uncharacterized membrane protein YedE/YeeE